jgi:hypothetical protein
LWYACIGYYPFRLRFSPAFCSFVFLSFTAVIVPLPCVPPLLDSLPAAHYLFIFFFSPKSKLSSVMPLLPPRPSNVSTAFLLYGFFSISLVSHVQSFLTLLFFSFLFCSVFLSVASTHASNPVGMDLFSCFFKWAATTRAACDLRLVHVV